MSRILLIEDHAELRAATRLWLVSCGHDVTTAASGAEALQRFADGSFDLILSDIGLPDTVGVELRARSARSATPRRSASAPTTTCPKSTPASSRSLPLTSPRVPPRRR